VHDWHFKKDSSHLKMKKQSAGILPFKIVNGELLFFIVHPGGPFFSKKDNGFWSIIKGEIDDTEEALATAKREFNEETGMSIDGKFISLSNVTLKSGKLIYCWAIETSENFDNAKSNTFEIEWPPKSGISKSFPEIDQYAWCTAAQASVKLNAALVPLLDEIKSFLHIK
jgi:predicted NUDIX family NTP pyrophosphohydrolase